MANGEAVSISRAIEIALGHHRAGRLPEAENIYRQVFAFDPNCFDAAHLLGVVAYQRGDSALAITLIERATAINPLSAEAFSNLGLAYQGLKRLAEAQGCFRKAVANNPAFVTARNNLAIVHQAMGETEAATRELEAAIAIAPEYAEAHNNLAGILQESGRLEESLQAYDRALTISPRFAEAHLNRGQALAKLRRNAEAIAAYRESLALKPGLVEANYCLGKLLQGQGFLAEALDCYEREIAVNPEFVEARWARTMVQLASVYDAHAVEDDYRGAFAGSLAELDAWFVGDRVKRGASAVGSHAPFYLAYSERNNRDLLSHYGDLCVRLMKDWQNNRGIAFATRNAVDKIRVGIVSGHLRNHSVWTAIAKGWMRELDRARISLHVFHTNEAEDKETQIAKSQADSYFAEGCSLEVMARAIADAHLDAILYPEIGMDPMTIRLASMRLAPIQAVTWGHPDTSGLSTIDYFLSAEFLEPPNAQAHYRERLVALPNLGCHYDRLDVTATTPDWRALELDPARPILVCPGTPYKYHPDHDRILVEIARRVPKAQLVLFDGHDHLSERMHRRLERAFRQARLRPDDQIRIIPWQPRGAFFGLLQHTAAVLDTIGFSGFNTAMQVIQAGVPLVTLEGSQMRGRLGSGILRHMGLDDAVATSEDAYVDRAVAYASNDAVRADVVKRIANSRGRLFGDLAPIRALEKFLFDAVQGEHSRKQ